MPAKKIKDALSETCLSIGLGILVILIIGWVLKVLA